MKIDVWGVCKSVLKKWYILLLAAIIGFGSGIFVADRKEKNEVVVTSQILVEQNFPEKYFETQSLFIEKNNHLINTALIVLRNDAFLTKQFESVGLKYSELSNIFDVSRMHESNIIEIKIEYNNRDIAKKLCENVTNSVWLHLNEVVLNNIDKETGTYKDGTLDSNKIFVREVLAPTVNKQAGVSKTTNVVIYAATFAIVVACVLAVYFMFNPRFTSIEDIKCRYDLKTTTHKSVQKELEDVFVNLSICEKRKKCLFVSNRIVLHDVVKFCNEHLKGSKTLVVGDQVHALPEIKNGEVRVLNETSSLLIAKELEEIIKNEKIYDYIIILKKTDLIENEGSIYYQNVDKIVFDIQIGKDKKKTIDSLIFELSKEEKEKTTICSIG